MLSREFWMGMGYSLELVRDDLAAIKGVLDVDVTDRAVPDVALDD